MAFSLFSKKTTKLVGVDVSTTAVKVIELSKSGNNYRVDAFGMKQLPREAIVDQIIADKEKVGSVLEAIFKRGGFSCKQVAIAASSAISVSKIIQMETGLTEKEIEDQIAAVAEDHIPYNIEEVALDFEILGASDLKSEDGDAQIDVLVGACRSEVIDTYLDVLAYAGLEAKIVEISTHALERSINLLGSAASARIVAIFDIGAINLALHILHNGIIVYSRDQVFGGNNLDELIATKYELSVIEAESRKRKGGLPSSYDVEVLSNFREQLAQQIGRSLQFFFAAGQFDHIDQIVLVGGTSLIAGLAPYLSQELDIKVSIANPFADMDLGRKVDANQLKNNAPSLMVACGLAMRSFD